jgi:taurine dioxygenase
MTLPFELKPLNPHIGARVEGIDVSKPMDDATADALQAALIEHLVLVFPEQDLPEEDQIAFAARFGPLSRHFRPDALRTDGKPATNPSVMMITNERENGKPVGYLPDGEIYFHTDSCFTETPQRAVCLYALELPSTGGDTIFASACRLLDTLPETIRTRLAGRSAVNCYEFGVTIKQVDKFDRSKWPHFRHPAIAHDERDGRDYLYVNELMTEEIEGLSEAENRETLDTIFDHIRQSPDSYWHLWQPGDLVLWDNRRALHARVDFPADEPRKLRRVPIADDRPVVMATP